MIAKIILVNIFGVTQKQRYTKSRPYDLGSCLCKLKNNALYINLYQTLAMLIIHINLAKNLYRGRII